MITRRGFLKLLGLAPATPVLAALPKVVPPVLTVPIKVVAPTTALGGGAAVALVRSMAETKERMAAGIFSSDAFRSLVEPGVRKTYERYYDGWKESQK